MTTIAETGSFHDDNSKFTMDFEEYKRLCREKYQQQKPPTIVEEEDCASESEEDSVEGHDGHQQEEEEVCPSNVYSPSIKDPRFTISPAPATNSCTDTTFLPPAPTTPPTPALNERPLSSSVDQLRSSGNLQRRNSLGKMISSIFKKSGGGADSPKLSPKSKEKKEKSKAEKHKAEQDFRMARFIAELEFEGRTDEEIQMHLFHLRDQAQFARPRSNSIGDWFRGMHQAFKDEFTARKCVTVHVSTVNPFAAAAPANYVHDLGYSYEDLLTLEPVPRGLKSLDHLPTCVYEGQELPADQTTCAVCMADFEVSEDLRSLNCTHHFHTECIDKWLGVATTCPVCKGDVARE